MRNHHRLIIPLIVLSLTAAAVAEPIEDDADMEINRLEAKYTGNKTMIVTLVKLRRSWRDYQSTQCFFEKTATAEGQLQKSSPPEAEKAHRSCLVRTRAELKAALAKF